MLYASYRRGFKSGGWSTALTNSARRARDPATFGAAVLNTTVDEEILQSYEAGIKSMWFDRRLRLNLNTFFYDYDDLQVFALAVIGGQITTLLETHLMPRSGAASSMSWPAPFPGWRSGRRSVAEHGITRTTSRRAENRTSRATS